MSSSPQPVAIIRRPAARTRGKNNDAPMKPGSRTNTSARRLLTTAVGRTLRLCRTHGAVVTMYVNLASGEEVLAASQGMRGAIDGDQFAQLRKEAKLAQLRKEAKTHSLHDEYAAIPDGFEAVDTDVPDHHVLYLPPAEGGRMFARKRQRVASVAKDGGGGNETDASVDDDASVGGGDDDASVDDDKLSPEDLDALIKAFAVDDDDELPDVLLAMDDAATTDTAAVVAPKQTQQDGLDALADMAHSFLTALTCVSLDISAR